MNQGLFITIEGPEGAGKTTVLKLLGASLAERGFEVLLTREPGGIPISEQIRQVILNKENTAMDGRTEALLYAAARRQHLMEKVHPALNEGKIVICDRFIDSSLAYQGYARGLGIDEVFSINQFAVEGMMPAKTIYFDIDPKEGLNRIKASGEREINRLDLEELQFHEKVQAGYRQIMKRDPDRFHVINAGQTVEKVLEEAERCVLGLLNRKN